MQEFSSMALTLKQIYKPKYIILSLFLLAAYYAIFLYLAYIQGGNAIMVVAPWYVIFGLIFSSSILMTIAIYSVRNTRQNNAKASGTATSAGSVILGSGLCGCTTTLLPSVALFLGASTTTAYAISGFVRNYSVYIFTVSIIVNLIVIGYYLNEFSGSKCN